MGRRKVNGSEGGGRMDRRARKNKISLSRRRQGEPEPLGAPAGKAKPVQRATPAQTPRGTPRPAPKAAAGRHPRDSDDDDDEAAEDDNEEAAEGDEEEEEEEEEEEDEEEAPPRKKKAR